MIKVFPTLQSFNDEFGIDTPNPLIHITKMEDEKVVDVGVTHSFELYQIYLIDESCGTVKYGKNIYNHAQGSLMFMSPRQIIEVENGRPENSRGWILMFDPELLRGTSLDLKIKEYSFFNYDATEGLNLTEEERAIIDTIFENIRREIYTPADSTTNLLLVSYIELVLNYSKRFYERQFATSIRENSDFLSRFNNIVEQYFKSGKTRTDGLPSVKYCAEKMNLSVNYLSDLLRKETGRSALEHIQETLIENAKERLLYNKSKSVSEIAYELGFEYPQYFNRLFKKRVGVTPNNYRREHVRT